MSAAAATDALAALAPRQPWLFGLLVAFNYHPADYVHRTRRAVAAAPHGDALWSTPRARTALSAMLLQALSLQDRPCADTSRRELPQALLEPARLERLARAVGAVVLGPLIRRSIARADVLRWKEELTPDVYAFAMQSAPLLPLQALLPCEPDCKPVLDVGCEWIAASLHDAPDELRERALLKLPAEVNLGAVDPARAHQVVQCVHSTLEPRWCSSFVTRRR